MTLIAHTMRSRASAGHWLRPVFLVSVLLATSSPSKAADTPTALTFADALQRAEQHSPTLQAAQHALAAEHGARDQAGLWPNPELSYDHEGRGNDALTGSDGPSTTIALSQRIELGGKRGARIDIADAGKRRSELALQQTRTELHANLHVRYTELLVAQQRAKLAAEQLALAERTALVVSEKVKAGKVVPLEATKAQISVTSARLEYERATRGVQTAKAAVAALWGGSSSEFADALGDYAQLSNVPELSALQERLRDSPGLRSWQATVDGQQATLAAARAAAFPDVTLSVGQTEFDDLGERSNSIGISIPLPLFDRNQGGKTEALGRLQQLQAQQQAATVQAEVDLQTTWQSLNQARAEADILQRELLPTATAVFAAASEAYRAGKFNLLDVLDAQRTLFAANEQHLQAVITFHQRFAELERLLGAPLYAPESVK